jgi:ABC-type Fe3+/spermidine/putrescine transport system ATPase subunit
VVAVDDLSLEVGEGEFVTLLGPSGCGKTTTLRMIAGFETPTKGRIYLAGEDVTELPPYRRQVNTVFQDYALFPHMTIRDNVGYGLRVSGVPKSEIAPRVAEALTTVGLLEKAEARPGNLSGGQKQRVALARALVRNPKVLLLDEPLSALDAKLREAMQVELKHLHQRLGLTFVFVTHDQTEALVMSDRVVVMDRGKIVQSGAPTELYDDPATPYVANFIGTSNMIRGEVAHANGELTAVRFAGGELHATRCGPEGGGLGASGEGAAPRRGRSARRSRRHRGHRYRQPVPRQGLSARSGHPPGHALPGGYPAYDRRQAGPGAGRGRRRCAGGRPADGIAVPGGGGGDAVRAVVRKRLSAGAIVSVPLLWTLAFLFVPYFIMFTYSFYLKTFPTFEPAFQFGNYQTIISDPSKSPPSWPHRPFWWPIR